MKRSPRRWLWRLYRARSCGAPVTAMLKGICPNHGVKWLPVCDIHRERAKTVTIRCCQPNCCTLPLAIYDAEQ